MSPRLLAAALVGLVLAGCVQELPNGAVDTRDALTCGAGTHREGDACVADPLPSSPSATPPSPSPPRRPNYPEEDDPYAGATLPPCASPTATNCDPSKTPPPSAGPRLHAGPYTSAGADTAPPGCAGKGTVPLVVAPMKPSDYVALLPYGLLAGAHVTPIDHMYFGPPEGSVRDQFEVRAVANGTITGVGTRPSGPNNDLLEYRLWIEHTCTFFSYADLVTKIPRELQVAWDAYKNDSGPLGFRYPIKAGDVIGWIGTQTLDFGVYNDETFLTGFLDPELYRSEPWKIHTDDPFLYFTEPAKSEMTSKLVRKAEPRAGKIDLDVDGRLVGNWFKQGTGGYGGPSGGTGFHAYYAGHLAFVPDALVPDHVLVSLGNYSGEPRQFAVKGNAPDPAAVSPSTGLVKYELSEWHYVSTAGTPIGLSPLPGVDFTWQNTGGVHGTVLVELVGPRLLKFEAFPGKAASEVAGFSSAAALYER